jgi:uncharacterized RDD family membrane protein YckC
MGAENLADLGQFAVEAPPTSGNYRPKASNQHRFMAFLLDAIGYGMCSALSTAILNAAFSGDKMTLFVWGTFVLPVMYTILPLYSSGQTPGKRFMKLQVVRSDGADDIGFWQALKREFIGKTISGFCLLLGFVAILRDQEQGLSWHDKIAKTRVISLKE